MERFFEVIWIIITLFRIPLIILIALIVGVIIFVRDKSLVAKIIVFIFVMVIVILILGSPPYTRGIYETVRGIKVVVVDSTTGKFLPDIVVYYSLDKGQLLPSLDTTSYTIVTEKYVTNKGGICYIPKHRYWKWPITQWTQNDSIAVNIDVIDRIKKEEGDDAKGFWKYFNIFERLNVDYYYNKNNKYRGAVMLFSRNGITDLEGRHMYKYKRYDLRYMELQENDDIVIVELDPKM